MSFGLDDVRRLLDAFEDSDWDEIHLTTEDGEVRISTEPVTTAAPAPRQRAASGSPNATDEATDSNDTTDTTAPPVGSAPDAPAPAEASDEPATAPAGTPAEGTPVAAPSPGIFWHAPSPGAPPFVEVGQHVDEESPIGIVEVMKLFNQVLAGLEGTVTAVLVGNGVAVDRGQDLVLIDPDQ